MNFFAGYAADDVGMIIIALGVGLLGFNSDLIIDKSFVHVVHQQIFHRQLQYLVLQLQVIALLVIT